MQIIERDNPMQIMRKVGLLPCLGFCHFSFRGYPLLSLFIEKYKKTWGTCPWIIQMKCCMDLLFLQSVNINLDIQRVVGYRHWCNTLSCHPLCYDQLGEWFWAFPKPRCCYAPVWLPVDSFCSVWVRFEDNKLIWSFRSIRRFNEYVFVVVLTTTW